MLGHMTYTIKNNLECRSDGDGEQSRDMCYIDNIVSANILAADVGGFFAGLSCNIACGDQVSNNQILNYLKEKYKVEDHFNLFESYLTPGNYIYYYNIIRENN